MTGLTLVLGTLLAPMVGVSLLNLVAAQRLHRFRPAATGPRVSLLVPARDEEEHLRRLLPALRSSRYPDLEIIVLDDRSEDGTPAVVRDHAARDRRISLLAGDDPPAGWTGKNWACHQLSKRAAGEILVFCDADVLPGPDAVGRTVAAMERTGSDVLTAFPRHRRGGWFEDAVVPVVTKLPIAATLPLPLVRLTRTPALSVGNGQWFAWRRKPYLTVGGHARVRGEVLEDVRLARLVKRAGLRLLPVIATRDLEIRMYGSRAETWSGFHKNLYLLAGGRDWTLALVLTVFITAAAGPFLAPLFPGAGTHAWLPLAALAAVRVMAAVLFADGVRTVALHPVAVPAVAALALASRAGHRGGTVSWKRRVIRTEGVIR